MKKIITITILCVITQITVYSKSYKIKPDTASSLKIDITKKLNKHNDLFSFLTDLFLPKYGEYKEVKRTIPPYTFFDNGSSISDLRTTIRDNISTDKNDFRKIYKQLFDLLSIAPTCGEKQICTDAIISKCAAFVYFVGYNFDVNKNLVDLGPVGDPAREAYYDLAISKLKTVKTESGRFGSWNWSTAIDKQRYRAFELIQYLQAYDYIYTTRYHLNPNDFNKVLFETDISDVRDKLADFTYELHGHANNLGASYDRNNNIAIIVASAVGLSSLMLSTKTTFLLSNQKKPERWAHAANATIARSLWEGSSLLNLIGQGPMGTKNKLAGYGEGSHYFSYAFQAALPFIKAYYQSTEHSKSMYNGDDKGGREYYPCALCFSTVDQEPYNSNSYTKLYKWYLDIKLPNGESPTVDDTWRKSAIWGGLALTGNPGNNPYIEISKLELGSMGEPNYDLKADYLLTLNYPKEIPKADIVNFKDAGDLIVRDAESNYIHVNAEKGTAVKGDYHEHGDVTSFIIAKGANSLLAMDPPFYGGAGVEEINEGVHHNVIRFDDSGPNRRDEATFADIYDGLLKSEDRNNLFLGLYNEINVKATYHKYILSLRVGQKGTVDRKIEVHKQPDGTYYIIKDRVESQSSSYYMTSFTLNGEGRIQDGTAELLENDTKMLWKKPCSIDPSSNYKMYSTTSTLFGGVGAILKYGTMDHPKHGELDGYTTPSMHTRAITEEKGINLGDIIEYITTIQVLPCNSTREMLKSVRVTNKYTLHLMEPDTSFKLKNAHIYNGEDDGNDTIINPLGIDSCTAILKTNGKNIFFSYALKPIKRFGCCQSKSNFRITRMEEGDSLIYNDTAYIIANKRADIFYKLVGKYKYSGYIKSDSDINVSFFLSDLDTNYKMKASNADTLLSHYYDDTAHIMTLFCKAGITNFIFDLDDPCVSNCYFPFTTDSIKIPFDFNNGLVETLPHKLTITTPNGLLNINSGSCMSICPGKWLRNTDSLILEGECLTEESKSGIVTCYDTKNPENPPTIRAIGSGSGGRPSTIIVNEQAALILDSGSYTRIGNNTTITVRPQGTLIIRKNAVIDIGDAKECGYGLIICYDDSYIHFEDSADIKFWKIEKDTNDKHKFFIFIKPPRPLVPAHSGIESSIASMLATVDSNIHVGTSVSICNITQIKPDYGINNREWGWVNFAKPKAWAYLPKQTFCPGECPEINFDGSLNNTNFSVEFYRVDSNYSVSPVDTILKQVANPYSYSGGATSDCDTLTDIPILKICHDSLTVRNKWYKVKIKVKNDCGDKDSVDIYYFMLKDIDAGFTINSIACIDSVIAIENIDSFTHFNREKTKWHIHYIDTASPLGIYTKKIQYGGDWEFSGIVYPDTFTFPDFKWVGGFYYAVSHTVSFKGCGEKIVWDTIFVAPGANIVFGRPMTYNQTISGNRSVQLKGYVSNADSFNWNPTTWLDSTNILTPISTPDDSITYILTAYKDGCVATDTAHIKYNRYANAGYADTLCFDSTHSTETLIGFPYDMSLFLGMLYYYDNTQFMSYYNNHNIGNISNYFRYFTHFMHTNNFKNSATSCTVDLFNLFTNTLQKELFFSKSWYRGYYMQFTQFNNPGLNALNIFADQVINNTTLKNHLDSLNNWGNIDPCINDILNLYDDYVQNHRNEITTTWSKIVNNDTTNLTNWNNFFVAENAPTKSSKYILSVIAPSVAEIDEITILVDTILTPLFAPAMQFDSTVYLMNYTEPNSKATHYEWNFGDGSANSFETHPIHTFPAFDSNYVVCLIASNFCSSFTYCDTVWIDSLHLGGTLYTKKQTAFYEINNASNKTVLQNETNYKPGARIQQLVALTNYPNPFNNSTIIDYEIWQNYTNAELRITNVLGQTLFTQKLNKPIDKIQVDGGALSNGIYYYSIIIDGTVSQTKNMSVIH